LTGEPIDGIRKTTGNENATLTKQVTVFIIRMLTAFSKKQKIVTSFLQICSDVIMFLQF
jgi:hypothetical protein